MATPSELMKQFPYLDQMMAETLLDFTDDELLRIHEETKGTEVSRPEQFVYKCVEISQ